MKFEMKSSIPHSTAKATFSSDRMMLVVEDRLAGGYASVALRSNDLREFAERVLAEVPPEPVVRVGWGSCDYWNFPDRKAAEAFIEGANAARSANTLKLGIIE